MRQRWLTAVIAAICWIPFSDRLQAQVEGGQHGQGGGQHTGQPVVEGHRGLFGRTGGGASIGELEQHNAGEVENDER